MSASAERPLGIGIVGLGFMGRTHLAAYRAASSAGHSCKVVAVCDRDPDRAQQAASSGNLDTGASQDDLEGVIFTTELSELLAMDSIDAISICTHTNTHVALACAALAAGKHVLVEKPVALTPEEITTLMDAEEASGRICMPAMCMRFWPGWDWLHDQIESGEFGPVRSAVFQRLSSKPSWSSDFYESTALSGGALVDLHIHDADFILWCFGTPEQVMSSGSVHHLSTQYRFADGPAHVLAEGGWDHSPGFEFRMRYVVVFQGATADFDIGRSQQLLLVRDGTSEPVALEPTSGYDREIRAFVELCSSQITDRRVTLADARAVAQLLQAEMESLAPDVRESGSESS